MLQYVVSYIGFESGLGFMLSPTPPPFTTIVLERSTIGYVDSDQ
ncbi:hypothetical protein A2U01_0084675, partial [Trifolium medium]|nr:hypothetical protein [Trifolium medium]